MKRAILILILVLLFLFLGATFNDLLVESVLPENKSLLELAAQQPDYTKINYPYKNNSSIKAILGE